MTNKEEAAACFGIPDHERYSIGHVFKYHWDEIEEGYDRCTYNFTHFVPKATKDNPDSMKHHLEIHCDDFLKWKQRNSNTGRPWMTELNEDTVKALTKELDVEYQLKMDKKKQLDSLSNRERAIRLIESQKEFRNLDQLSSRVNQLKLITYKRLTDAEFDSTERKDKLPLADVKYILH